MTDVKHTPGPWKAVSQGGSSTVLSTTMPARNDRRSEVPYGYRNSDGYCVGYPFLYQSEPYNTGESTRMDFVCFSHSDARLIAAAPDLLDVAKRILDRGYVSESIEEERDDHLTLVAAIAKATGGAE